MKFKMKLRGYDPAEVDKYIEKLESDDKKIRADQKERIDQLSDENYSLRQQLQRYQADEEAISKSLIVSQHLAQEMKFDAEKYSNLVLSRAKIFYATWHAYAQTLISSLSQDEVDQFNSLQRKIETVINAYEGKDIAKEVEALDTTAATRDAIKRAKIDAKLNEKSKGTFANPIAKIEQAANQTIDLRELARTDLSLEDLCAELGLTTGKSK